MKRLAILTCAVCALLAVTSCGKSDEVPPVADKIPSRYKLPDPQTLTSSDRALIDSLQKEYDQNVR
uniref:hypothetical protein n=1 Tax=Prevotella sp. TaxID=59823 RepID=UPI004029A8FE